MRRVLPIAIVIAAGVVAGALILRTEKPKASSHDDHGEGEGGHDDHAGHGAGEAAREVAMTDESAAAAGITTLVAGRTRLDLGRTLPGVVTFNRNRLAHIVPRLRGRALEIRKTLGDAVRRGEVLAVIDAPDLADARRAHLAWSSRVELARSSLEREERLWSKRLTAERNLLAARQTLQEAEIEARSARQLLEAYGLSPEELEARDLTRYAVRSPIDGIVTAMHLSPGEAVSGEADIFVIADLSSVWVEAAVFAKDIGAIAPGIAARVTAAEIQAAADGKVMFVGPSVGEEARSVIAVVELANPKRIWKPGLFVDVALASEAVIADVAVKNEAIQMIENRSVIFVRSDHGFLARDVALGRTAGGWTEITSGLKGGERYAVANSFVLKADLGKGEAGHDH